MSNKARSRADRRVASLPSEAHAAASLRSVAAVTNAAYGVAILTDAARTFKARMAVLLLRKSLCCLIFVVARVALPSSVAPLPAASR